MFLAYRILVALFCFAYIIRSGFYDTRDGEDDSSKWFIYLTNWAFVFLTTHFLWAAGTAIHHVATGHYVDATEGKSSDGEFAMRWFHRVGWLIFNLAIILSLIVSLLYWSLVYPGRGGDDKNDNETATTTTNDFSNQNAEIDAVMHAVNSVLALTDVFFSGTPVRILHAVYPMIGGAVYGVFSVIYWAADGTNSYNGKRYIYPILDYSKEPAGAAITLILSVLVAVPVVQLLVYGCYRLRVKLVSVCCAGRTAKGYSQPIELQGKELGV